MCYGVGQECDSNNSRQPVFPNITLYYIVQNGWW